MADAAQAAREKLIEAVAETDDALLEEYLEKRRAHRPSSSTQALRKAVRELPAVAGAVRLGDKNIGVPPCSTSIVDLLPSPVERGPIGARTPTGGEPIEREPGTSAPFSAFVFKTIADPFAGKLSVFQVLSGRLNGDSTVLNVNKDGQGAHRPSAAAGGQEAAGCRPR